MGDVAKPADVSLSTVDRALDGRIPVRNDEAERVLATASALGVHGTGLMERRLVRERPKRRFGFILQLTADHVHGLLGRGVP